MADYQEALIGDSAAKEGAITSRLLLCTVIGSLGAAQFGFHIGVLNIPQATIESDFGIPADTVAWSMIVATFSIAAMIGALSSSSFVDAIGRRRFLVLDNVFFVIGGMCAVAVQLLKGSMPNVAYALMICSRFAVGLGSGAATVGVPLYLGEIAPSHMKGAFGSVNQFMITVYILVANFIGLGMSTSGLWGWMVSITAGIGAVGLLLAPALLESPRWLVARSRDADARNVLVALRGYSTAAADAEVQDMREQIEAASRTAAEKPSLLEVWRSPDWRAPLVVACVLQTGQQLSGINAVFFFSTGFFSDAGLSNANVGTIAASAVNVLATALAVYLIDRTGRRPLLLVGAAGMMLSALGITVSLVLQGSMASVKGTLAIIALVFVMLFVTFFEVGLGAIPWIIGGEMLPEAPRATVMGAAAAVNWFWTTVIAAVFPIAKAALGNYSFAPFVVALALVFAFTLAYVPETRGKSPAQVTAWFNKGYTTPGADKLSLQQDA